MSVEDPSRPFAAVVVEALAGHGVRPRDTTSVDLLRAYVSDLYRYEIRRLRRHLLAGGIAKADYADAVRALRRRYVLLSVPKDRWRVR